MGENIFHTQYLEFILFVDIALSISISFISSFQLLFVTNYSGQHSMDVSKQCRLEIKKKVSLFVTSVSTKVTVTPLSPPPLFLITEISRKASTVNKSLFDCEVQQKLSITRLLNKKKLLKKKKKSI